MVWQSSQMTNMARVIGMIQMTTKMCLKERSHHQHPLLDSLLLLLHCQRWHVVHSVDQACVQVCWHIMHTLVGVKASMEVSMPLVTTRSSKGMLVHWEPILSFLCCLMKALGLWHYAWGSLHTYLKVWIYQYCMITGASLMCTTHLKTIR